MEGSKAAWRGRRGDELKRVGAYTRRDPVTNRQGLRSLAYGRIANREGAVRGRRVRQESRRHEPRRVIVQITASLSIF